MRKLFLTLSLFSAAAFADTLAGTLVDVNCKDKAGKDLAENSRQCAIKCAKSGFGLVTADGKFIKFDEAGNTKALDALKASEKEKDLKATVTGTVDGDTIKVESITLD
jgi:hypothetical protein